MKSVISALLGTAALLAVTTANAGERVVNALTCSEDGAPMFDAVVVNVDRVFKSENSRAELVASVYHRVEQGTILVSSIPVAQRQAHRVGAPIEFHGKDFYLEVNGTVRPSSKGLPGMLELRSPLRIKINMNCRFAK